MILETSFVIDFLKNEKDAVTKLRSLVENDEVLGIAAPTIFELWTGLHALDKTETEKNRVNSIINSLIVYHLDYESATVSGKINGELIKKGLKIDPEDCMIAGIAIINNQKLLTKDEHFKRIEGLKVVEY